ncbi:hypothetical protein [Arthrobacter sp. GMC3]|uniref:hypothetical protein n=1 Tax=Arthrobacter sp. GMC3 TaxID=2058894 RepID=UPI000CE5433A|nr:hypothetical protein [Arthrobacter sp. GMC3]
MASPAALEDLDWPTDALNWLEAYAWSGLDFTADDLRKSVRPAPHGNMVGGVFQAARKLGIIRPIGFTESNTPSRKHSVIRVWRGVNEGVRQ